MAIELHECPNCKTLFDPTKGLRQVAPEPELTEYICGSCGVRFMNINRLRQYLKTKKETLQQQQTITKNKKGGSLEKFYE